MTHTSFHMTQTYFLIAITRRFVRCDIPCLIKRHRVLDKTYLLSSFPWPPLLGHAPHVSLSYISKVLRHLPMPSCLDLAITDIALRAILYSVTFTDSQNETCFRNFPEGCATPSFPYQSSFSCSQQAFPAAISCFCFLHITPVLYGHTVRNNINFHWSEPGYRSVLFIRSKPFVLFIIRWMNLATVTYFTYHTCHSSGILSVEQTWWPFRTLRTIHAIRPVDPHLDDPFFPHFLHWPLLFSKRQISLTDIDIAALATTNCH